MPAAPKRHRSTYQPTEATKTHAWYVADVSGKTLGRAATRIASVLRGKHLPTYATHDDNGDFVIVINADKVKLTGRKLDQRRFYWHTGYPGGIKDRTQRELLEGRFPERVVENAVRRMMPGGPLTRQQLRNLRVYAGTEHPHAAQQPQALDVGAMNPKNVRAQ